MADEEEDDTPTVELGEGVQIEGAPVARVASRLTWPQEAERVRQKEGNATVRTPDGPRQVDEILDEADETYFDTRQTFVRTVERVIGTGPVETAEQ